jgi:tRNA A-37 threonylcarbamoyl transferase component Bud32
VIRVGSVLAGYRLDGLVGQGATAVVYAATHLGEARRVALKVLAPHLRDTAAVRSRFREAALLQRSLEHENVLDVEDVVEDQGELIVVLPLVGGGTLSDPIADGALSGRRALMVLRQVAAALDFAHAADVPHGDVKPRNVLLDGDGAYLSDFGLAAAVSRAAPAAAASPGTIGYSAPERLRGEAPTASADIYSLACMLFECVTGAVPYAHETAAAVVGGHLYSAPPPPSDVRPDLPHELDDVLAAGLAKDPAERPRTARELVEAAAPALEHLPPAVRPARTDGRAARPLDDTLDEPLTGLPPPPTIEVEEPRGLSWPFRVAAALALVVAAIVGAWLGQRSPEAGSEERFAGDGLLAFEAPDGWTAVRPPRLSGLTLERPAALAPANAPRRVTFVAGATQAGPPTFLPHSLLDGLARPPRRSLVRLESGVAYRYARPVPTGFGGALTVFVLPAGGSSAVAACTAPRAEEPLLRECESLVRTLEIRRGTAWDPTPNHAFAAAHNTAMEVLRVARNSGLELLAKATARRGQARAATEIAVAYRTTVASIRRTSPTPIARAANARLVAALDRAGVGYTRLAGSARRGDARAYAAASRLILAAEADMRGAHHDLGGLGYAADGVEGRARRPDDDHAQASP